MDFGGGADTSGLESASIQAAQIQSESAQKAADTMWNMYQTTRGDLSPWRTAGQTALDQYMLLLGLKEPPETLDVQKYLQDYVAGQPGYQFQFGEGQKAIERSAAARGLQLSGAQEKALTRYGQDYASLQYNGLLDRIANLSGSGQNAAAQLGAIGSNTASNIGNALMQGGQAVAQGGYNAALARQSGYQSSMNNLMNMGGLGLGSLYQTGALGALGSGIGGLLGLGGSGLGIGMGLGGGAGIGFGDLGITSALAFLKKGGSARKNNLYVVGEEGPELFIPKEDGYVVSNNKLKKIIYKRGR